MIAQEDTAMAGVEMSLDQLASYFYGAADEIKRLRAIEAAARKLLTTVCDKSQPWDSPENKTLAEMGDVISVNEGNLWALQSALTVGEKP
jgi:hypothetical protein